MLALVMTLSMFTIGCTESDELTDITPEKKETPSETPEPISDDFTKALADIKEVSDVKVEDVEEKDVEGTVKNTYRYYTFFFSQLVDHKAPSNGNFKQQVRIRLSKNGLSAPVVLYNHGYNMSSAKDNFVPTMTKYLDATTVWIEHRYFGNSLPEPFENLEFTYLNADQAAQDLHAIVSVLKQTVLKESGKWISTGVSKDGITSGLYAYYSDIYGWNDIDLYMPFCAPFLEASPESCDDLKMGQYLYKVCGSGYPAGSVEDIAYQRLRQIPTELIQNKELRDACLRMYHQKDASEYIEVINTFGRDEEKATAGLINLYFNQLYDKFSYVLYKKWAPLVPELKDTEKMAAFIALSASELQAIIDLMKDLGDLDIDDDDDDDTTSKSSVKDPRVYSDNELLMLRDVDPTMPYYVQAVRELGNIRLDLSALEGLNFPGSTNDFGFLAASVAHQFEVSVLYKRYANQWDGGKLMKSFRQWVKTQNKYNMIFCYSFNDNWTGGAIDESTNPKVKRIICRNGTHNDYFLNADYYTEAEKQQLLGYIRNFIGL